VRRAFVLVAGLSALVACNAIVGVEDVTLRRTSSASSSGGEEDGGTDEDADVPPEDGGSPGTPSGSPVAAGNGFSCARLGNSVARCWGSNEYGQLGNGAATSPPPDPALSPVAVSGITSAAAVCAGFRHACALNRSGTIGCWGLANDGRLGNGQTDGPSSTASGVKNVTDAVNIACGAAFTCATTSGGGVKCWGNGGEGQLGAGSQDSSAVPVAVIIDNAVSVSAGEAHACAVRTTGKVSCWGRNAAGQLGIGNNANQNKPAEVQGVTDAVEVAAGTSFACARTTGGAVFCWGSNESGQLGINTVGGTRTSPVQVAGISDAAGLAAGDSHVCAVRKSGSMVCWGNAGSGRLGTGSASEAGVSATPSAVATLSDVSSAAAGFSHTCAATRGNKFYCWGDNLRGQLGIGNTTTSFTPLQVQGL
jgi:alpha-tubulin suppressor-like RCC1 family protein